MPSLRRILFIFFVGISAWALGFYVYNNRFHQFRLEHKIHAALLKFHNQESRINLAEMTGGRLIRKVCFQGPYDWREHDEEKFSEHLPSFTAIDEDRYVWWFFYEDGYVGWINVPRLAVMDAAQPAVLPCISGADPIIRIVSYTDGHTQEWRYASQQ